MRRLFAAIGLPYLTVLAVVYFFYSNLTVAIAAGLGTIVMIAGVIRGFCQHTYYRETVAAGLSVLAAALSIFLYWNIIYQPIINNYSDKEINIQGYICDEIITTDKLTIVPIQTETVNGEPCRTKLSASFYFDGGWEPFDVVNGRLMTCREISSTQISKGYFLQAIQDDNTVLRSTGEHHFSVLQYAVALRGWIKQQLSTLLSRDSADLCRAIFLGDKLALNRYARYDFSRTGTTYLIVVSGLHLSILCGIVAVLCRPIRKRRVLTMLIMLGVIVIFSALTGFTRSVIRAGIMLILTHCGGILRRKYDSLNAMGAAALLLSVGNPFVVGDLGVLFSFAATLGIVSWADKIDRLLYRMLRIEWIPNKMFRAMLHAAVNLFCVSLSASLWVLPISMLAFQRFSPLVVVISCLTSPLTFLMMVGILLVLAFSLIPFAGVPTTWTTVALEGVCRLHLMVNHWFAVIPFANVRSDKPFLIVWVLVSVALVAVGHLIHAGKRYVLSAAALSLCVLTAGWSLTALLDRHPAELMIFSSGNGTMVAVGRDNNLSLLAAGGAPSRFSSAIDELYTHGDTIDNLIVPNRTNYAANIETLGEYFHIHQSLVNGAYVNTVSVTDAYRIADGTTFSLRLNSVTTEEVFCTGEVVYQYLTINGKTVLFMPHGGDGEMLPEAYRTADIIIMDFVCQHPEKLRCRELIYTGTANSRLQNHLGVLQGIADEITLLTNGEKIITI